MPHPTARLAELAVGQAHETVAARLGEHPLEQDPGPGLTLATFGEGAAGGLQAVDQVVAQGLELGHAENPWPVAGGHADVQRRDGESGGQRLGQLALEA